MRLVRKVCHRLVLSDLSAGEWDRHQSALGRQWRQQMNSMGKIVAPRLRRNAQTTADRILATVTDEGARSLMQKDMHLVTAALATDLIVVSVDDAARGHFARASGAVDEVKKICWVNPLEDSEEVVAWLENGAPVERRWLLPAFLK